MALFYRDLVRNAFILSYQTLRHYQKIKGLREKGAEGNHSLFAAPVPSVEDDATALAKAVAKLSRPPTLTEARDLARSMFGKRHGDQLYKRVAARLEKYGLTTRQGARMKGQSLLIQ